MKHKRILVAEADQAVRVGLDALMAANGAHVLTAASADEATQAAAAFRPDAVIASGGAGGLGCIAGVRAVTRDDLPALLLTGNSSPELPEEARQAGVTFLAKPAAIETLIRTLRGLTAALAA